MSPQIQNKVETPSQQSQAMGSPSPNPTQSSLTRKAHQFSSLKKKRGTLFNKLFCSPSTPPPSSPEERREFGSSCVGNVLTQAADTLNLDAADQVRKTVQDNMFQCQNREDGLNEPPTKSMSPCIATPPRKTGSLVDALDDEDDDDLIENQPPKLKGGLVIPTPFQQNKEPLTMDGFTARKINKSPIRSRELNQSASYSPTPSNVTSIPEPKNTISPHVSQTVQTLMNKSHESVDMATRLRQSIQKKQSVAMSPKVDDDEFLPDDFKKPSYSVELTADRVKKEMEAKYNKDLKKALEQAKDEWQAAEEARFEAAKQEWESQEVLRTKSQAEETLADHGKAWKNELDTEMGQIKEEYEAKIAELKDQTMLAQRLAKSRESQLAQTEDELAKARRSDHDADAAQKQLKSLQAEFDGFKKKQEKELERAISNFTKSQEDLTALKEAAKKKTAGTPTRKGTTIPKRSPARSPQPSPKQQQLRERQMESLKKQIKVLEEQSTKVNDAHNKALSKLRDDSAMDVARIKAAMEAKLLESENRAHDLELSLSESSSRDREELLGRIQELEAEQKFDRATGLKEVERKEEMHSQIAVFEKKEKDLIQDHQQTMKDLRETLDTEIQQLKDDLAKEQAERATRERELELALSESSSSEKTELKEQIERLTAELEAERSGSVLVKLKLSNLENDMEAERTKLKEDMDISLVEARTDLRRLQNQFDSCKNEWETKHADLEERLSNQTRELEERTSSLETIKSEAKETEAKNTSEFAEYKAKMEEKVKLLETQFNEATTRHAAEIAEHKRSTDEVTKELEDKVSSLQQALDTKTEEASSLAKELESVKNSPSEEENKLRSLLARAQADLVTEKKTYDERVRKVGESHSEELDELLKQLDLVEAEHTEKLDSKTKLIGEKEEALQSLRQELKEIQAQWRSLDLEKAKLTTQWQESQQEGQKSRDKVRQLEDDLVRLKATHEDFVAQAEKTKEEACNEARDETIARAESQFKQANDLYIRLKKQFDTSTAKVSQLEQELKSNKTILSKVKRDKETNDVNLRSELAEAKAANASAEADAAAKAKAYRKEMAGLLKAANDFENKAMEAESLTKSVQTTLANVVAEKQKLQKQFEAIQVEREELKQVCEELMSELEGQQNEF